MSEDWEEVTNDIRIEDALMLDTKDREADDDRFVYNPKGTLEIDDVIELKAEVFLDRKFKLLGFSQSIRNQLKMIITENGGYILNKNDVDFAIIHENYTSQNRQTLRQL